LLVMTKAELIQALRRGKWWKRRQALQARLPENAKCARYFTPEQDGLRQDWRREICWCNPPYTRYVLDRWVQKAYEASHAGATVVCLLPVSTTSQWWKRYVLPLPDGRITYLEKRLKFGGSRVNARFDNVMVIFRPPAETHTR
jgi:phage N-6-adenine-methyltransferase